MVEPPPIATIADGLCWSTYVVILYTSSLGALGLAFGHIVPPAIFTPAFSIAATTLSATGFIYVVLETTRTDPSSPAYFFATFPISSRQPSPQI